jgi:diacylglycerol kinase family enzyme
LPGGFVILPDARVDDGVLDVLILAPSGLPGWVQVGLRVAVRSRANDRQLERHRARTVEIRADAELPRQVDGEVMTSGRSLTVAVRPGALLVRVPA